MSYTTATLLENIAKRAAIPTSQGTFSDAEILEIATEAIETEVLPKILQARQEFYVKAQTFTSTKESGDLYSWIRIPARAVGQAVIGLYDVSTDEPIDQELYWVEGNKIIIDSAVGSYRLRYYLRPNSLVETTYAAQILTINRTSGIITVTAAPSGITTGTVIDFIKATPGFDTLGLDVTISLVSGTSYTFAITDIPSELAVGDYIAITGETPVPQIPAEWYTYLAQWATVELLESLGDLEAAAVASKRLPRIEKNALSLISPRIEKKSKAIVKQSISRWWR
jgi:hypothetical protein